MERQTRLKSSKSSLAKSVLCCCCLLLLLPIVSLPVPFYSQNVKICFAWLLRVWSLVSIIGKPVNINTDCLSATSTS